MILIIIKLEIFKQVKLLSASGTVINKGFLYLQCFEGKNSSVKFSV